MAKEAAEVQVMVDADDQIAVYRCAVDLVHAAITLDRLRDVHFRSRLLPGPRACAQIAEANQRHCNAMAALTEAVLRVRQAGGVANTEGKEQADES